MRALHVLAGPAQWVCVALALFFTIGSSMFPAWWKRFLLGGGIFLRSYWSDAISYLGNNIASFQPVGVVVLGVALILAGMVVFVVGRYSTSGQVLSSLPRPPRAWLVVAAVLVPLVFASLFFVEDEYWTTAELTRSLEDTARRVKGVKLLTAYVHPPASGTFLYIDRERALEQYAVLNDSLAVAAETTKEGLESKTGITGTVPNVGSLGVEEKKSSEKSVTRTAPALTSAIAVTRLINTLRFDENIVDLSESYFDGYEYRTIMEGLQKRGVTLSPVQNAQLEKAEIERFEAKVLQLQERRSFFYKGRLSVIPGKNRAELVATVRLPPSVTITGPLKLEYLSSHIHHCFEEKRATCEIGVVTLLGVMERVESVSEKARKVFVMPIAIW